MFRSSNAEQEPMSVYFCNCLLLLVQKKYIIISAEHGRFCLEAAIKAEHHSVSHAQCFSMFSKAGGFNSDHLFTQFLLNIYTLKQLISDNLFVFRLIARSFIRYLSLKTDNSNYWADVASCNLQSCRCYDTPLKVAEWTLVPFQMVCETAQWL